MYGVKYLGGSNKKSLKMVKVCGLEFSCGDVERLAVEADDKYTGILFPVTKYF